MPFRLPESSNRLAIVGATGSGKTVAEIWHISMRDIDKRPHLVYNFKREKTIDNIPHIRHIGLDEIPVKPGLYVVHPHPNDAYDVERQLWAIWERGGVGVHVDEGYMMGTQNPAFRAILTQGRSLEIPVTVLSQRPVWMDRFVFSESEFYQIFRLQHRKDRKLVEEFVPQDLSKRLPEFHSYYYDAGLDVVTPLRPVPDVETIYKVFDRRLSSIKKVV